MRGFKLRLFILILSALLGTSVLTFYSPEASWSQNAATKAFSWLLNFAVISIGASFLELAHKHPKRNLEVYKWLKISIKLEHLCFFTAWAFFFIVIFHLNSPNIPEDLHNISTGLAVLGLYLVMAGWYRMWSAEWWLYFILINASSIYLILSFSIDGFSEVKYAEFAILLTGLFFIYDTLKDR